MPIEREVHIVDCDGEVLYPRAIISAQDPSIIKLMDAIGGHVIQALLDASGWDTKPGYATAEQIAMKKALLQKGGITPNAAGNAAGNTAGNTGGNAAAGETRPQLPCNTEPVRVGAAVNFKIDAATKAALEMQAARLNLPTSALLRNLIVAHFAATERFTQSATPPSATPPSAPLRDDPLIVSGLAAFHEATAQTETLLNAYPTAPGIANAVVDFRYALKSLETLAEDDRPPNFILNILRHVRNTVVPTLPAFRQMRADIEAARPTVNTFAFHLHAARDQLQELIWSCEQFC